MSSSPTITLAAAGHALRSPSRMPWLFDLLQDMPSAELDAMSELMFEALRIKSRKQAIAAITGLLKLRPDWVNAKSVLEQTPLMQAVTTNRLCLVKILLEAGARPGPRDKTGMSALDEAAAFQGTPRQQAALANTLLQGAKFTKHQKNRALCFAASSGNLGMVNRLLANGATVGQTQGAGNAIVRAIAADRQGDGWSLEIVRALLASPSGVQMINQGWEDRYFGAPVHCAAATGNMPVLRLLLDAGACVNPPTPAPRVITMTPLMHAAFGLQPEAMELLIAAGADATSVDGDGKNAMHYLANTNCKFEPAMQANLLLKGFVCLVNAGADPVLRDNSPAMHDGATGQSPMSLALENGQDILAQAIAAHASATALASSTLATSPRSARANPRL